MLVVSLLFAVAAATAAVVLAVRVRRQGRALGAAADRAAALEVELDRARGERATQTVRADTAEAERTEAQAQARAASAELAVAVSSLTEATRARDALGAELDELRTQHAACGDVALLWSLELARVERRWQLSVAPGIDMASPLASCAEGDRPRVAIEILGAALREESGTRVGLAWELDEPLLPATALVVVRAADELIAANALRAERVELAVREDGDAIAVHVRAFDHDDVPVEPTPFGDVGGAAGAEDAPGVVRVPRVAPTAAADADDDVAA